MWKREFPHALIRDRIPKKNIPLVIVDLVPKSRCVCHCQLQFHSLLLNCYGGRVGEHHRGASNSEEPSGPEEELKEGDQFWREDSFRKLGEVLHRSIG